MKNLFLKRLCQTISQRGEVHFMNLLSDLKPHCNVKPLVAFLRALSFVTPVAKLRQQAVNFKVYNVGYFVSLEKRQLFGFTLIKKAALLRKGRTYYNKLFAEVFALNNQESTGSLKMKQDLHKSMSETKSLLRKRIKRPRRFK